jgi:hypothetical protein
LLGLDLTCSVRLALSPSSLCARLFFAARVISCHRHQLPPRFQTPALDLKAPLIFCSNSLVFWMREYGWFWPVFFCRWTNSSWLRSSRSSSLLWLRVLVHIHVSRSPLTKVFRVLCSRSVFRRPISLGFAQFLFAASGFLPILFSRYRVPVAFSFAATGLRCSPLGPVRIGFSSRFACAALVCSCVVEPSHCRTAEPISVAPIDWESLSLWFQFFLRWPRLRQSLRSGSRWQPSSSLCHESECH